MRSCVLLILVYFCQVQTLQDKSTGEESCSAAIPSSDNSQALDPGHWHDAAFNHETYHSLELLANSWRVTVTDPPNLKLLVRFPMKASITASTRYVNILEEVGVDSSLFGIILLDDSTGNPVKNIVDKNLHNHVEANKEIVFKWLLGNGQKPVTWYKLMQVLRDMELQTLAGMISDSVSDRVMNISSEGAHYSLETIEFVETLQSVYAREDLLDPDLWLSQYLPEVKYINLTLEENGRETNLNELLSNLESESGKRILLTGCPGVGKTTLLRYISKLWVRKKEVLKTCQVLIKIPLGSIDVPFLDDIAHLLKVVFRGAKNVENLARDLKLNKGEGACLLLDAYDELKTENVKKFIREFLTNGVSELHLPKALRIITSRSVSMSELKPIMDRTVEVVGIDDKNLQLFFESLDQDKQQSLNAFFKRQRNAQHLCHIPLYLSMVVFTVLGNDTIHDSSSSIDTETDLFTSFISLTLEQYRRNRHPDWNRFSLWKCSFSEESTERQCEGFRALCSAAFSLVFRYMVSVQVDVAQGVLDILQRRFDLDMDIIEEARDDLRLVVEIANDKDESRDVVRFSFTDESYEEFVQALHLAGLPEQETVEIHNLVGKGKITEEHVCSGYTVICSAMNDLLAQGTDGPPVGIMENLQERSPDGKTFGYEPKITETLEDLSLAKITRKPTVYGEVLQFAFPHKTFQEFLSALYMSSLPENKQLAYIALYGKEEEFDLVFQFLFGLLKDSNSNISKLLQRYSSYRSADHRNVVLKLARETQLEGKRFKSLVQESGILVNSSLCVRIKDRDDCSSMRYTLKQTPVQKLGLHLTLLKSSCMYYSMHRVEEVHLTINCPLHLSSYDHLKRRLSPVVKLLTYLSVRQCILTPDDVLAFAKQLQTLTELQTLHLLVTTDLTVAGAEALLTALQSLPHLTSLQLDMEVKCTGTQVLIGSLRHLKFLRHLSLTLRSTDEKTLKQISYRREHSCWKYGDDLQCPYHPFIDCFCSIHNFHRHLQYRGTSSKLAVIALSGNCSDNVHTPVEHSFAALGKLEHLETLILPISLDQNSETAALLGAKDQLSNLKNLDLSYNYVFDDNYTFVKLHTSELQFLDIGHTSWELENLVKGLSLALNLQTIKFTDSRTHTDAAVKSLEYFQHFQHLRAVILDHSDVNDTHVPTLSSYTTNMHSLRVLDLGCNKITSIGFNVLVGALQHLQYFHHLDVSYNQVSVVDIESTLGSLQYLNLAGNGMGVDGAASLAAALKYLPNVEHLDLSDNKLTSNGVLVLVCELHLLTNLQYLDLSYNQLSFDFADELAEGLKKIVTLKYLSLAGNKISRDSATVLTNHLTQLHHLDLSNIANQLSLQ